ncbi:MAG: glycosyltransferase [Methylocella sp.]
MAACYFHAGFVSIQRPILNMLFVRDFAGFTGGHLKFLDYMKHTAASELAEPVLYQTARSRVVPSNIFNNYEGRTIDRLQPFPAYFIAGEDWFIIDDAGINLREAPIVNLIQGLRHAEPGSPLFSCLARPALRICVSPAVADAIREHANGDVHVICNGIEFASYPAMRPLGGPARVFVAGLKNTEIGLAIAARLDGLVEVELVTELLARPDFLARMAEATVCIFLPTILGEGFFLPPLEAMALGRGVIVPDCGGNRAYCQPGQNCLMPAYDPEALATGALMLVRNDAQLQRLADAGRKTAAEQSIEKERSAYHALLARYLGRSS